MISLLNLILPIVLILSRFFKTWIQYVFTVVSAIVLILSSVFGFLFSHWLTNMYFFLLGLHAILLIFTIVKLYKDGKQSSE